MILPRASFMHSIHDTHRLATASFGLQGIKTENVSKVEETVYAVLEKVYKDGFNPARIDNVIHQIELGLKHV